MRRKRIIPKILLCVLIAAAFLGLVQRLLVPKYIEENEEGVLAGEYYANYGSNDVLFVGDCEVYSNFSPITLWQEYGITSIIRGTPSQTIWQSYYMIEDTLRYETPKVVVFNVFSMQYDKPQSEAYNRLALDGMKLSMVKYRAVKASMTEEESLISYLFPLLRFHSRWSELKAEDFKYFFKGEQLSHNGYVMRVDTKPVTELPQPVPRADYSFSQIDWDYLNKMRDLCAEKGITLVLIKSASCYPHWFDEWDKQIADYAEKNGLTYLNMLKLSDETGIDYTTDTFDAGMHLNLSGAEKSSRWLAGYLQQMPGITDRRDDRGLTNLWNYKIDFYEAMKASQYKQLEETGKVIRYR